MTLEQIFKYVNYISVKENTGSTLQPQQRNTILEASNISMFNRKVAEAQAYAFANKIGFSEATQSILALREFHVKENITFTAGVFDITTLTNSYAYWGSMVALFNGAYRQIELLTDHDLTVRRSNLISKQLSDYPAATLFGNSLTVYPSNVATAEFFFLKNPIKPVYDYYLNTYQVEVYLVPAATHVLTSGETGSSGETAGTTVTSTTVELEWGTLWHEEFCLEILKRVGINIKDEQLRQYIKEAEGLQK